jgi:hypothetical protein
MVVAVITMRVMEVTINQVVYMISMGDSFMSAAGAVYMASLVTTAGVPASAVCGIGLGNINGTFIIVAVVFVV